MKKIVGVLAAATVSAWVISTSSSTSSSEVRISRNQENNWKKMDEMNSSTSKTMQPSSDKFAPRFDGLRFIETLITAHR